MLTDSRNEIKTSNSRKEALLKDRSHKPPRLPIRAENIPDLLKQQPHWVVWRWTWRNHRWDKPPIDARTGNHASTTAPKTWCEFETALRYCREHKDSVDGIGFVLGAGDDPVAGVDLDDCRDPGAGEVDGWALQIVDDLRSYAELSPSGTGLKVFLRAKVPPGPSKNVKIEIYGRQKGLNGQAKLPGRYFTVTGHRFKWSAVNRRQDELEKLHCDIFAHPTTAEENTDKGQPVELDDSETIRRAGMAKNGDKFKRLWAGDISGYSSRSEADLALCSVLAFWVGPNPERIDKLFRISGLMRKKWEREDYRKGVIAKALEGQTECYKPRTQEAGDLKAGRESGGGGKDSQATRLVKYALEQLDLFHTPEGQAFATTKEKPHQTWPLRSKPSRQYLNRLFWLREMIAPGSDAIQTAINTLEGAAVHDGAVYPVFVRMAEDAGKVYLDLGDQEWRVVAINQDGWEVAESSPVKFRRSRGMLPLPVPRRNGDLEELRGVVNVATDDDWRLLIGWLLGALSGRGPFPILCLHGEQGSAKSTTARVLRNLLDPNSAALRSEPRDPRDLIIAATNSGILALDNLSYLPGWLSDGLCRLATGGGFGTRELYTDSEEVLFDAMRPVILTSIEDLATRGDLLERALILTLPAIQDKDRLTEADFWRDFENARPRILGALLNAVAGGLSNLPNVRLDRLPRMADFARLVTACEPALGWQQGVFLRSYRGNIRDANELALGDSPIVAPLRRFQEENDLWTGSASDLLMELTKLVDERIIKSKEWPKRPNVLSGKLRRLAPNLRKTGLSVEFTHTGRERQITLSAVKRRKRPLGSLRPLDGQQNTANPANDLHTQPNDPETGSLARKAQKNRGNDAANAPNDEFRSRSKGFCPDRPKETKKRAARNEPKPGSDDWYLQKYGPGALG